MIITYSLPGYIFPLLNLEVLICWWILCYFRSTFKPVMRSFCCCAVILDNSLWENCSRIIFESCILLFINLFWIFLCGLVLHWLRCYSLSCINWELLCFPPIFHFYFPSIFDRESFFFFLFHCSFLYFHLFLFFLSIFSFSIPFFWKSGFSILFSLPWRDSAILCFGGKDGDFFW